MKIFRALYWTGLAAALLLGLYTGNRFTWMVFLVMALLMLAALGINAWTIWSFSYIQELGSPQGEKGRAVSLHIGIYNDKPFPFTHMRVRAEAPDPADSQILEINLPPRASCSFDLELPMRMRGDYQVGMTRLEFQDVFGLLPMSIDLRWLPYYRQKPLLVLPRTLDITLPNGRIDAAQGQGIAALGSGQDELAYLRSWQPGDRMSRVHWKASAKSHELLTRQYEDPAGGGVLIYLDCRELPAGDADRLTDCAASLLRAHLERGDRVLIMSSRESDPGPGMSLGMAGLTRAREWLALLEFSGEDLPSPRLGEIFRAERIAFAYLLGPRPDPGSIGILEEAGCPGRCWVTEPLNPGMEGRSGVVMASINGQDPAEFLIKNLGEWVA